MAETRTSALENAIVAACAHELINKFGAIGVRKKATLREGASGGGSRTSRRYPSRHVRRPRAARAPSASGRGVKQLLLSGTTAGAFLGLPAHRMLYVNRGVAIYAAPSALRISGPPC